MTFEETMSFLDNSMQNNALLDIIGPRKTNFEAVIKEVKKQMEYLVEHDTIYDFNFEIIKNNLAETSGLLKIIYLDFPIENSFAGFVKAYCMLIINWNNNILKDKNIDTDFSTIHRMYDGFLTTSELLMFTKMLLDKIRLMSDFASPSIELSKLYLNMLDGKK